MAITLQDNSLLTYDEWLLKRNETLGASEVNTVIYGNPYTSNLELFYRKIGAAFNFVENIRMYLGKATEEVISVCWSYYDGSEQSVVENCRKQTPVKACVNINSTFFNDKYKHLSATPDRKILDFGKYKGCGEGLVEIKNTQGYVMASYADSLPLDNVIQLVTQLLVCELDYGELFYFIDNKRFECHPIHRSDTKEIEEKIILHTTDFWNRVVAAKPLYNAMFNAKMNMNNRLVDELSREISLLEPEPQFTVGYRDFLSSRYKDKMAGAGIIQGKEQHRLTAKKHMELQLQIKALETEQMKYEIELKQAIGDMSVLDFGKGGKVSWAANKNGNRLFKNQIK